MSASLDVNVNGGVRKWKRYPSYQETGVEWVPSVPQHWKALKIKRLCLVKRGASPRPIDDPIYFDESGEYAWVRISDVTASERYLLTTEQRLSAIGQSRSVPLGPGELFLSIAATVGKPIITQVKCCIHDGFVYFVGLKEDREYLYYLFSCGEAYKGLGKHGTQLNLNTDTIGDIKIPLPPLDEQRRIVTFLDRETAKIDGLIAKKERLIELLQEKRTALISHAVTKGVDNKVPMKDSSVEWVQTIPTHWTVLRNGFLFFNRDQRGYPDLPILEVSIHTGVKVREFSGEHVEQKAEDHGTYKRSLAGDLAFNKMRMWQGAVGVTPEDGLVSPDYQVCRPRPGVHSRYFEQLFRTSFYMTEINRYSHGIVKDRNRLYWDQFKEMPSLVPPPEEQVRIIEHIDAITERTSAMIAKVREAIDKLHEYRTALISAAVTGKIDVREEVA